MAEEPIDKGLAEAFGRMPDPSPAASAASVLRRLQARTDSVLGVQLGACEPDDASVEVTEEIEQLRHRSGRYHVLGEIGRGGVGVVYKCRDPDLGRDVAMKVLRDDYAARPDVLARFVEEAQVGGQLQHPGIVPVYELGLHAGNRPYFAMKLVKGETLATHLARRSDPGADRRRLLGIFEQVCQTMAYAHNRRVVHRDLKPANVMIGAFGEVQIVDWGFAKVLSVGEADEPAQQADDRSLVETVRSSAASDAGSVAGSLLGTPAYMSPEQANGEVDRLDRRSDVFGLGAILCEILTGKPPYPDAHGDVVRQAADARLEDAHARLRQCYADAALVALCTECLSPARRARPRSAAEVAVRIGTYLTSVEERARDAELRAAEARYRHRTTLVSAVAVLVVVLVGAGAWIWRQSDAQLRRSRIAQRIAAAMNAASGARGEARAAAVDSTVWAVAVASTEQLVSLAQSDDVEERARAEAEALLVSVREERRAAEAQAQRRAHDDAMLARLENLRIPIDENVGHPAWPGREARRLDTEYAAAFTGYLHGASPLRQSTEATLAAMRRGEIEIELATSLDHWALVRDAVPRTSDEPDPNGTVRIREVAGLLEPDDPWRTRLRTLLPNAAQEGERLLQLSREAETASLTAAGHRVLSAALWYAGERDAAVAVLRRGQELHSQDFDLCFSLALHLTLLDRPEWEPALAAYRIAHALRPNQNEVLHRQAQALEWLGKFADAERVFRMLAARQPENTHWLRHVAETLHRQGKPSAALELYERALVVDPSDTAAINSIGGLLARQGKLDAAFECFERALHVDPSDAEAHCNIGNVLLAKGKPDEAIERFERALAIDPLDARFHVNLGRAYRRQEKEEAAVESFRRATEIDNRVLQAHVNLGLVFEVREEYDEAVACYERAVEIAPRYSVAHMNLGNALRAKGKLEEAIGSYRRAIAIDSKHAMTHNNLGAALAYQGRLDEAIESYRRALEVDPNLVVAYENLGIALIHEGRLDDAIELYDRALTVYVDVDHPNARGWESYFREKIQDVRRLQPLEPALTGQRIAASSEEWSNAIDGGYRYRRFEEVAVLTEATLQREPGLTEGARGIYQSACSAARLAALTAPKRSAIERARLRRLAHAWLAREFERWQAWLAEGGEPAVLARERMRHTIQDSDFASLRGDALEHLPETERAAWEELWSAIERASKEAGR